MTIIIFDNTKGIIRGSDPRRIISRYGGVLQIGDDRIKVEATVKNELPILCDGYTGEVDATFYCDTGCTHELLKVRLEGGVIVPPTAEYENLARDYKLVSVLNARIDEATKALEKLYAQRQEAITALSKNPLKHLIE